MSSTDKTTTTSEGPTLYEQASDAVTGAGEAISSALGYEKESDAHKVGREAAEAVTETAEAAGKAVGDAYDGAVQGSK